MTKPQRDKLIERYAAGPDEVASSLQGISSEGLTAHPFPGKWSAAEIVHHLADSEMTAAVRLRRLLVEDAPVIYGYDQDEFAVRLRYREREIGPALEAFHAARATSLQLLKAMTAKDWARQAWHTEGGPYGPERWLELCAAHAHTQAAQIERLRLAVTARSGAMKRKRGA